MFLHICCYGSQVDVGILVRRLLPGQLQVIHTDTRTDTNGGVENFIHEGKSYLVAAPLINLTMKDPIWPPNYLIAGNLWLETPVDINTNLSPI